MKSSERLLGATAVAAFAWVMLRAATQAITIDEATTYLLFVGPSLVRLGSTNNHVLNSMLMWLSTNAFGLSEFTARIPALLGAGIYIIACVRFCRRIGGEWWLQWIGLMCLIGSPFVMDYLVAARGYGLALGFLMMLLLCDFRTLRGCAWASVFGALCLASNFSFAFAALAAGAVMLFRSLRETKLPRWQLLVAYLLPGLALTWFISLPAILNFPRQELWYGAHSLRETFASITESQLRNVSVAFAGEQGARILRDNVQPYLFPILAVISILWLAWNWRRLPSLSIQFGTTFVLTLALHFIAFHAFGLLYPFDRTALFLLLLGLGTILAAASISNPRWLRCAQIVALGMLALNNLLCLRYTYFEEWPWDRDTDQVYAKVACLHDRDQVNHVASGWPYIGALMFYRETATDKKFEPVVDERDAPPNTEIFVIESEMKPAVVQERKLTPIWSSHESPAQIAVPPEQLERLKGSSCVAP